MEDTINRMNKTHIEWTDFTWNPVTGCQHDCWYCYVKKIRNYDRTPAFHPERILEPMDRKKPSKIFVCSTGDLFGTWVPDEWIAKVKKTIAYCPNHIFQLLTKNPKRYKDWVFPGNCWLAGAIGLLKNPSSHRDVDLDDPGEVAELILFSNYLIRLADRHAKKD